MNKDYRVIGLEKNLHKEFKRFCVLNDYTMTQLVGRLVREFMDKQNEQQQKEGDNGNNKTTNTQKSGSGLCNVSNP